MPNRSLREILDEANPNKALTAQQMARLGSLLDLVPRFVKGSVASGILTLPQDARAGAILAAFVTAGTTLGPKTPAIPGSSAAGTPATTLVTTSPEGHIAFNIATDAVTAAEVLYVKEEGEVFEEVVPVASNVGAPLQGRNIRRLLEATALAGTVTGACIIDQRGFTVATTKHAAANVLGTGVAFLAGDGVTSARIKYIATPGVGATKAALGTALDVADKGF